MAIKSRLQLLFLLATKTENEKIPGTRFDPCL